MVNAALKKGMHGGFGIAEADSYDTKVCSNVEGDRMEEQISLYRDLEEQVIVFHNRNVLPHVNVPHLHSQYEFYYNIDGAQGLFADKKFYECAGHDLFLIPRTCVHKVMVKKGVYYERCIINIDSKVVDAVNAVPHMHRPLQWLEGTGETRPRKVNLDDAQHREFVEMVDAYSAPGQSELLQYARLLEVLSFLGEHFPVGKECRGQIKKPDSLTEQALIIIEEDFKNIRISEISERLYVNSSHLSVLFKEEYGITLEHYLIIRKIAEAKKYLYMGVPVNEVCGLCGFRDYSNFIRTFKKFEGYSPGNLERLSAPL